MHLSRASTNLPSRAPTRHRCFDCFLTRSRTRSCRKRKNTRHHSRRIGHSDYRMQDNSLRRLKNDDPLQVLYILPCPSCSGSDL